MEINETDFRQTIADAIQAGKTAERDRIILKLDVLRCPDNNRYHNCLDLIGNTTVDELIELITEENNDRRTN